MRPFRHGGLLLVAGLLLVTRPALAAPSANRPSLDTASGVIRLGENDSALTVSLRCPALTFEGLPAVGGAGPASIHGDLATADVLEITYPVIPVRDGESLDVKLRVEWSASEQLLRMRALLHWNSQKVSPVLKEVTLEDLNVSGRGARLAVGEPQSYPAFFDGFFAGIEFPVAATRLDREHLLLAHRPGVVLAPGAWYETRSAVIGAAPKGRESLAFQRYIAGHLPQPHSFHVNYNSWWTSPVPYKEHDIRTLMGTFKEKLYTPYKTSFDTFCIDMGWSNAHILWEIDPRLFPSGFTELSKSAKDMNCRLGLWISPSSCYPPALDNEWAAQHGYETFLAPGGGEHPMRYACLGGKRYQQAFQARLVEMATRYGVRHFKLDGYQFTCPESGHGHAPGISSSEAIAEGLINAAEAVRKAAPDVWFEPTCFGLNPSPWWLFHFNSVIGSYGDDAPYGRVPAPIYRESYTTARDYFNLQGAYWSPVPIAAQEVLGIVHQTSEPFMNDAVMTVIRGHMFLPVYLNPAYMNDERWKSFAALLSWARINEDILQTTEPILPASWRDGKCPKFTNDAAMPREPYGYAHWRDGRGLVALRNPWIVRQTISFAVGGESTDTTRANGRLSAVSIYPEPRIYSRATHAGASLDVSLAPYETVVLAINDERPPAHLPSALPHARPLRVSRLMTQLKRLEFGGHNEKYGPDWTCPTADVASEIQLQLGANVKVASPCAEVLVLYEDTAAPPALTCAMEINDTAINVDCTGSESGWSATGLSKPEHWVFYRGSLLKGLNSVHVVLSGVAPTGKVSAWAWATKPCGEDSLSQHNALPSPESISLDSEMLVAPVDLTSRAIRSEPAERPIERINGVFLDALTPVSVTQGYGTLQRNQSVWEKSMTIAGKRFQRGLGTHAPSRIVYNLDGAYRRFQCWAGADSATAPTITFTVLVDAQKRWESGPVDRTTPPQRVDLDIVHAHSLELVVGDGGNGLNADHADWADAQLVR